MIISYLDRLLNYVNRFYNRQFITRRHVTTDLLTTLDTLLTEYVNSDQIRDERLPTVRYLADRLSMSPNYLSDLLKKTMGQSTQQYINNKLVEKAKELLASSSLSVSEIAFYPGFKHAQSFNRFFRQKASETPLAFRQSFN